MKQEFVRMKQKLASRQAETLAELLVSVLVISLGLTMFATALMSARRMLVRGDLVLQNYYSGRNLLEAEEDEAMAADQAEVVLEKGSSSQNLAAPEGSGDESHMEKGRYQVQLYSDFVEEEEAPAIGNQTEHYRYQRIN